MPIEDSAAAAALPEDEDESPVHEEQDDQMPIRELRLPSEPSEEERKLYGLTHLPIKSWCSVCTRARARDDPHGHEQDDVRLGEPLDGPERLQMDYVDVISAHRADELTPIEETVRGFNW